MREQNIDGLFRLVGDGSGRTTLDTFYREELQLAFRNRGMPLEGLRYPITPIGMHYLLTHFDIPDINEQIWKLRVGGLVSKPMVFSLDEIKSWPSRTVVVTMECAGNGRGRLTPRSISQPWLLEAVGTSEWTGVPLKAILDEARIDPRAVEVLFTGLDQGIQGNVVQFYQRSIPISEISTDYLLLAYEMNGRSLEPQHGFPLRLIVPGWYGMASVKWLDRIDLIEQPFEGPQMMFYQYTDGPDQVGSPASAVRVRALMIPPGIPDWLTRTRLVARGVVLLSGRAWAGRRSVSTVEVSQDGGNTWWQASIENQESPFTWQAWSYQWAATPGAYTLCVRATDSYGEKQPLVQAWNYQGLGNNMVQTVEVMVD